MTSDILFTKVDSQSDLFEAVANQLLTKKYVTEDYRKALMDREKDFPTGLKIDYKDGSDVLYAAIPHTETSYCLVERVVYVRNDKAITFKHMINPEEDCHVQDFFFIINNRNDGQTDILSNLITFFMTKGNLEKLASLEGNENQINQYLIEQGVLNYD